MTSRHQASASLIRHQIRQNLPADFDQREIDKILHTMTTATNAYVIFFKDAPNVITYDVQARGSIKRFGFKQKLLRLLTDGERPILAITLSYVGSLDVYQVNENGTDFTRKAIDQSQSPSSSAVSITSSNSSSVAGASSSSLLTDPDKHSPQHNTNYLHTKKYYENVFQSLYRRPHPEE